MPTKILVAFIVLQIVVVTAFVVRVHIPLWQECGRLPVGHGETWDRFITGRTGCDVAIQRR